MTSMPAPSWSLIASSTARSSIVLSSRAETSSRSCPCLAAARSFGLSRLPTTSERATTANRVMAPGPRFAYPLLSIMKAMPDLSDFRLGSEVLASDGRKAGVLASVLVARQGFGPEAIVVKDDTSLVGRLIAAERLYITDEVVIPITAVNSATHELIRLSMSADEVRSQAPYLSYRFKPLTAGEAVLDEAETLTGGVGLPNTEEVANKPSGAIEID